MQVSDWGCSVWYLGLLSMILLCLYHVKCQTLFVQVPSLTIVAGARSPWIIQICRDCVQAPILSRHGWFPVRAWFSGQETISTWAFSTDAGWAARKSLMEVLSGAASLEKGEARLPRLQVWNVAYMFPSNGASVISQIACNVRMSLKVYCLCS